MSKIIIIDIETSGSLIYGGKIVEIGIVELDLDSGLKKNVFNEVIFEKGITTAELETSWIINNSDLTVEDIMNSKQFDLRKDKIQEIINMYPIGATAYNNKFEFEFLENRKLSFLNKLPCPMILSTDILKLPTKSKTLKYPKVRKYRYPTVEEAYAYFFNGSNYHEKHRAYNDAFYEADIVYKLYELGVFNV